MYDILNVHVPGVRYNFPNFLQNEVQSFGMQAVILELGQSMDHHYAPSAPWDTPLGSGKEETYFVTKYSGVTNIN